MNSVTWVTQCRNFHVVNSTTTINTNLFLRLWQSLWFLIIHWITGMCFKKQIRESKPDQAVKGIISLLSTIWKKHCLSSLRYFKFQRQRRGLINDPNWTHTNYIPRHDVFISNQIQVCKPVLAGNLCCCNSWAEACPVAGCKLQLYEQKEIKPFELSIPLFYFY